MKKFLAIFLAAVMLSSISFLIGSAATGVLNRKAGGDLDGTPLMIKGDDVHRAATGTDQPVYINKFNKTAGAGDTVIISGDEFSKVGDIGQFKAFTGLVANYDRTKYRYVVKTLLAKDADKSDTAIPADGFVILVSTDAPAASAEAAWKTKATNNGVNIAKYVVNDTVAVQGIPVADVKFDIYKTKTAPTLDGIVGANEYGAAVVEINGNSRFMDYRHFQLDDQYATGKFYATYDNDNIYVAWEISSEHHHYPVTTADSGMWAVDCVQINLFTINPLSYENLEHFDRWIDTYADSKFAYQIGVGVNANGETKTTNWIGSPGTWQAKATRDNAAGKTIYEAKLPKAAFAVAGYELDLKDGNIIGLSFSINTYDTKQRVMRLRDGGGIFGSNDYGKTPVITFKGEYKAPETSKTSTPDTNPGTGDNSIAIFVILAIVSTFGTAIAVKKARYI